MTWLYIAISLCRPRRTATVNATALMVSTGKISRIVAEFASSQ